MVDFDLSKYNNQVNFARVCQDFQRAFEYRKKSPTKRVFSKFLNFFLPKDIDSMLDLTDCLDFHGTDVIFDNMEKSYKAQKKENKPDAHIGEFLLKKLLEYFQSIDRFPISKEDLKSFSLEKNNKSNQNELIQKIIDRRTKIMKPIKIRINRLFKSYGLLAPIQDNLGKDNHPYQSDKHLKNLIHQNLNNISNSSDNNLNANIEEQYVYSLYKLRDFSKELTPAELEKQKNKKNLSNAKKRLNKIVKTFSFVAGVGEAASFVSLFTFLLLPYIGIPALILAVPFGVITGVSAKYFFDTQVYDVALEFLKRYYKNGLSYSTAYNILHSGIIITLSLLSSAVLGYISFLSGGVLWGGLLGSGLAPQIVSGIAAGIGFFSSCFFMTSSLESIISTEKVNKFINYLKKTFVQPWYDIQKNNSSKSIFNLIKDVFKVSLKVVYKASIGVVIFGFAAFASVFSFEGILKSLHTASFLSKAPSYIMYGLSAIPVISLFFSTISKAKLASDYVESIPENVISSSKEPYKVKEEIKDKVESNSRENKASFRSEYILWMKRATNLMALSFIVNTFSEIGAKHLSFTAKNKIDKSSYSGEMEGLVDSIKSSSAMEAFTTTSSVMKLAGNLRNTNQIKSSSTIDESSSEIFSKNVVYTSSEENTESIRNSRLKFC